MPQECLLDRQALMMLCGRVFELPQTRRYQASAATLLTRAGERKLVGGQEDQLIDIALELQREAAPR
ncbi:MAG: hypothetical protein ACRDRN_09495 [Sciscionella sp.]